MVGVGAGLVIVGMLVGIALLTGWITMLGWNATMPYLFGLKTITYMQGFWLNVLGGLLFKSSTNVSNK